MMLSKGPLYPVRERKPSSRRETPGRDGIGLLASIISAHIMGVRVSETMAEMISATDTVPELRKSRQPFRSSAVSGMNTCDERHRMDIDR